MDDEEEEDDDDICMDHPTNADDPESDKTKTKKGRITWTNQMKLDLITCRAKAQSLKLAAAQNGYSVGYMKLMAQEWEKLYPDLPFHVTALQSQLHYLDKVGFSAHNLSNTNVTKNDSEIFKCGRPPTLSDEMKIDLLTCRLKAENVKSKCLADGQPFSFRSFIQSEWLKLHPDHPYQATKLMNILKTLDKNGFTEQHAPKLKQNDSSSNEGYMHTQNNKKKMERRHVNRKDRKDTPKTRTEWTPQMNIDLLNCKSKAQNLKNIAAKLGQKIGYIKLVQQEWVKIYPNYQFPTTKLQSMLYILDKAGYVADNVLSQEVPDSTNDKTYSTKSVNILEYHPELYKAFEDGIKQSNKSIFNAICFNCGCLLYGMISDGHKFRVPKDKCPFEEAPVHKLFPDELICLPIESDGGQYWYSCRRCTSAFRPLYPCGHPETGLMTIPDPLKDLANDYERSQVSLLTIFSTTVKKNNPFRRVWEHKAGEVNLATKFLRHYLGMYGAFVEKVLPGVSFDSNSRIVRALTWLKNNNSLFRNFFANIETLYRHTRTMPVGSSIQDGRGKPLSDHLGKEDQGVAVPYGDMESLPQLNAQQDEVAHQHPKNANVKWEQMPNVTYADPDLEAKAWPHLFPYGKGSWYPGGPCSLSEYAKHRLLSLANWWRKSKTWAFFMYDRLIKSHLFYCNRMRRMRKTDATPSAGDLREEHADSANPYDCYGTDVPPQISGSKSYWSSKLLDLLAVTRKYGQPTYFITLTQNDNWKEIQDYLKFGNNISQKTDTATDDFSLDGIEGDDCIDIPTETTISFYQRFQKFKEIFILNRNSIFGRVNHFWFRTEYQKRGALHIHGVLWCEEGTESLDSVIAEMPRAHNINEPLIQYARSIVSRYQTHKCLPDRCFMGPRGTILNSCKYGFPFGTLEEGKPDDAKLRYLYKRREKEDANIVPYNLPLLLFWKGHVNLQKVTKEGWALYLAKYISKGEMSMDIKLPQNTSATEKYLRTRIVGRLEVETNLLGYHLSQSSVKVLYLPTEIKPTFGYIKKKKHLPDDNNSTDVFYDNLFEKYLDRPDELKHLKYPEMMTDYTYAPADGNSEAKKKLLKDKKGRSLYRRKHPVVTRWRFFLPHGEQQEKYYEQSLVLHVPFTRTSIKDAISPTNNSKTYIEECALRGICHQQEDALNALHSANMLGMSFEQLRSIALQMRESKWLEEEACKTFLEEVVNSRPDLSKLSSVLDDDVDEDGDLADLNIDSPPKIKLEDMVNTLTPSQLSAYNTIAESLQKKKQVLAAIAGSAGTGKSYVLEAISQLAKQKHDLTVVKLATTGVAANLIGGSTVHHLFRLNISLHSFLEKGTPEFFKVKNADVIAIDEFSLLEKKLFYRIEEICRQTAVGQNSYKPFGGKHIILLGDPLQLPAIECSIYSSMLWTKFTPLVLTDIKRQDDEDFISLLQKVRLGDIDSDVVATLENRVTSSIPETAEDLGDASIIVSLRKERDEWNNRFLDSMSDEITEYKAIDTDGLGNELPEVEKKRIQLHHRERYPDSLKVCPRCRVVLLKNIDVEAGWVNGTIATVIAVTPSIIVIQSVRTGKRLAVGKCNQNLTFKAATSQVVRVQFPLALGWALTCHKVQGMTLKKVYIQLNRSFFASGQAYVALSRVKSIDGLHLLSFDKEAIVVGKLEMATWQMMLTGKLQMTTHSPADTKPTVSRKSHLQSSGNARAEDNSMTFPKKQKVPEPTKCTQKRPMYSPPHHQGIKVARYQPILTNECNDLLRLTTMSFDPIIVPDFCITYRDDISAMITDLQNIEPVMQHTTPLSKYEEIVPQIHPAILNHYTPITTSADGNCLYNAISISLCGTEDLSKILRIVTAATILYNQPIFEAWLLNDGNNETILNIVKDAWTNDLWGNEYHMQALSMALQRPIYQYTSFKAAPTRFHFQDADDQELSDLFTQKKPGTAQHIIYNGSNQHNRKPVFCILLHQHFSALLPNGRFQILFTPHTNFFPLSIAEQ